jgi:hypothetical protein
MTDEATTWTVEENETLDKVIALWKQADEHSDLAEVAQSEADNQTKMSEDKEDEAEALWAPLAEAHPEWWDQLRSGEDPRESEA